MGNKQSLQSWCMNLATKFLSKSLEHIKQQPKYLKKLREWLNKNENMLLDFFDQEETLYFVGCGDSYFVALYGRLLFELIASKNAFAENSYEFLNYRKIPENGIIVTISASGRTGRTVDCAKIAKKKGLKVVTLINSKDSPITKYSDLNIITGVPNPYGPPSSTSTTALYSLAYISIKLAKNNMLKKTLETQLLNLPTLMGTTIIDAQNAIFETAKILTEKSKVYLVGAGPGYITSLFGAAKFREALWAHSISFEAEEFHHYGLISLDKEDIVILISPTGKSTQKMQRIHSALKKIGINTILLTNSSEEFNAFNGGSLIINTQKVDEILSTIIDIVPLQMLAIMTAIEKGLPVTGFRYGRILSSLIEYVK